VHGVLEDLAAAGLPPGAPAYNALLAAHAQRGAWHDALDLLQHMLLTVRRARPAARGAGARDARAARAALAHQRHASTGVNHSTAQGSRGAPPEGARACAQCAA